MSNNINWTKIDFPNSMLVSVAFANNTFVAVGSSFSHQGILGTIVVSSDNGNTWNTIKQTNNHLWSIAYGNNTFVVVGDAGAIVVSKDNGKSWNLVKSFPTNTYLWSITYGNNTFVVVGDSIIKLLNLFKGVKGFDKQTFTTNHNSTYLYSSYLYL